MGKEDSRRDAGGSDADGDGKNLSFIALHGQPPRGHCGACPLHSLHHEDEKAQSQGPASNINQLAPALTAANLQVMEC